MDRVWKICLAALVLAIAAPILGSCGGRTPDTTAPGGGGLQQAIEGYNEAIRLNPQYSVVYYNRGVAYYDLGRYERAIEDYGEAVRLNPQLAEPYAGRALAYIYLGRDAEADRDVDRAVALGFSREVLGRIVEQAKQKR